MPVTNRYYGGSSTGAGKIVSDFGLCDIKGGYIYTAKLRPKGLLAVVFFSPETAASVNVLKAVQEWTGEIEASKWSAVGVATGDREAIKQFAETNGIDKVSLLVDYDFYQTRSWGISHIPSLYIISGKTGRVLERIVGDSPAELKSAKDLLSGEVSKILAAEAAAKQAEEEKKAAEAAAKAAEAAAKPAEPAKA
ncbi:hypothetical protein CCAX7_44000 [Capsulimonas corticalis]|uniref:Uncharacterized protein n=1 Tax=Capsulimonas corticalis TaxID=2219043 RepID=A0A402CX98_9BACT|nr:redoxin domain-containing protein [Capsulimonas corticalis]BDI32349.1 hypothetical protein CCAX7_44000 [Capsulimonas corticalis]